MDEAKECTKTKDHCTNCGAKVKGKKALESECCYATIARMPNPMAVCFHD